MSEATDELVAVITEHAQTKTALPPSMKLVVEAFAIAAVDALVDVYGEPRVEIDDSDWWFYEPGTRKTQRRLVFPWQAAE